MKNDYRTYHPTKKEWISLILEAALLCAAVAYLFYRNVIAIIPLIPLGFFYVKSSVQKRNTARRDKLLHDFREMLSGLTVALRAGYSVENAFRDAEKNLIQVVGRDSDMTKELMWMNAQISLSVPVERLLMDFGRRSGSEDIENFAAVFAAAKRMGGSTADIVRETAVTITSKII